MKFKKLSALLILAMTANLASCGLGDSSITSSVGDSSTSSTTSSSSSSTSSSSSSSGGSTDEDLGKCGDIYAEVTGDSRAKVSPLASVPQDIFTTENVVSDNVGNYYSGFDINDKTNLAERAANATIKGKKNKGYGNFGQYYPTTDADPRNPGNLILFYTGESRKWPGNFSGSINREHVWPNSRSSMSDENDLHQPRPADKGGNGSRGNNVYGIGANMYDPGSTTEGNRDEYRGIAARIILYTALAYGEISGKGNLVLNESTSNAGNNMGILSQLLEWNIEYPVTYIEMYRNDRTYEVQGNRNIFIDYPSLGCDIWGDTNDKTRAVCANEQPDNPTEDPDPEPKPDEVKVSFQASDLNKSIYVDEVTTYKTPSIENNTEDPKYVYFSSGLHTNVELETGETIGTSVGTDHIYVCDTSSGAYAKTTLNVLEEPVVDEKALTIAINDFNLDGKENTSGTVTSGGVSYSFTDLRDLNNGGIWFFASNSGALGNTSAYPSEIDSIELSWASGGSQKATVSVEFGTEPITSGTSGTSVAYGETSVVSNVSGAKYFRITSNSSKNAQFDSIIIHFKQ